MASYAAARFVANFVIDVIVLASLLNDFAGIELLAFDEFRIF
jgi:hypothetical protein